MAFDTQARPITEPLPATSVGPSLELPMNPRVFVIPASGGRMYRVTPRDLFAFDPEWNPRTGSLVAVTEQGIVELGRGRAGPTKGRPVWKRRLTLTDTVGWSPSFSPTGSELALVTGGIPDVWVLKPATGRLRQVTRDWRADGFVDWSPDGKKIAAVRLGRIFLLRPGGAVVRAITAEDDLVALPAWSPNGRRIAFTRVFPPIEIVVANQVGDLVGTLRASEPTAYPTWCPDGKRMAYAKYVDESWDLFVRDLGSGRERRLTRTPYDEVDPAWSRDGRWLAFTADERTGGVPTALD